MIDNIFTFQNAFVPSFVSKYLPLPITSPKPPTYQLCSVRISDHPLTRQKMCWHERSLTKICSWPLHRYYQCCSVRFWLPRPPRNTWTLPNQNLYEFDLFVFPQQMFNKRQVFVNKLFCILVHNKHLCQEIPWDQSYH